MIDKISPRECFFDARLWIMLLALPRTANHSRARKAFFSPLVHTLPIRSRFWEQSYVSSYLKIILYIYT